jgi:isoleucyl-tRNA synthetase
MPLIYRAVSTWFVAVEKIKDKILANNELINWVPHHIKAGRFGKWLENARDWAVSRNRYWGTPLPIWRSDDGDMIVISSAKELEDLVGREIPDLHRHFIDQLTFEENGKIYKRVSEVFDCWFESGSMPYAQNHYPFENQEETMRDFPADFIAEGLDQTRGWFYTLTVIASALFDQPAFSNVIVNGIVLAEDGHKMSKRLKNYPDPEVVIDKFGSDAIRLYLLNSPVVRAEDVNFSEAGVEGILKQVLLPLWNSYSFLATYADIYEWIPTADSFDRPKADIDRWILSKLQKLTEEVETSADRYQLDLALQPILAFIDDLTNWYIRRSRSRFWCEENTEDRRQAFETLYTVILAVSKLAAPFMPFMTEAIYQELKREGGEESIHLTNFPKVDEYLRDIELEEEMQNTQAVVNAGHALRKEHMLKVRQPLKRAHIITSDKTVLEGLQRHKHLICEELNVKEILFHEDESKFVKLQPKPNFRVLGKKVGKFMNQVKEKIDHFDQITLKKIFNKENVAITIENEVITLTEEDVLIERKVLDNLVATCIGTITIALDTEITPELKQEGIAREIVNKINTLRKQEGFEVTDRIELLMEAPLEVREAFDAYKEYIFGEVLAKHISFGPSQEGSEIDINEHKSKVILKKVGSN